MKKQGSGSWDRESGVPQIPLLGLGNSRSTRRFLGPAIILLAAFVAVAPQLIRGNSCGHDFDVHLVSWLDAQSAWHNGTWYPQWAPSPNYGAGEPRFVYYPPLTWMLGAALGLVLPWTLVPITITFLCLAGAGLATRALALEACSDAVATLAGCAALYSGFALFTAYERSAFPEFTGGIWLPLLLLFALRRQNPSAPPLRRAFSGSTVPLALVFAAAWLSNLPLGVMASYLLAGTALLASVTGKTWAPVLRAAVAAALGFGLSSLYWLPAALERHWVDIRQATQDPGYNFENSWLFARHANPDLAAHDAVLRQASWIAVSMIAVAIAGLVVSWRRGTLPAQKTTASRLWWIPLAAIPFAVFFLLFPVSRPVWRLLPEMPFLQYPWRWLEAVEAPMAIFFASAVWPAGRRARWAVLATCTAAFLGATAFAATDFFQVCNPEDTVASTLAAYRAGQGFEGMYEYEPPDADETLIAGGLPAACLVSDPSAVLGQENGDGVLAWNPAQGSCQATFALESPGKSGPGSGQSARWQPQHWRIDAMIPRAGYLVLRLLSFPAWSVRVNGRAAAFMPRRDDGLIAVPVPQGPVSLTVDWTITPASIAGRWLSGISVLLAVALLLWELRLFNPGAKGVV